jgi:glycosyltransferase involved in cell wall biosynthesis
VYVTTGASRGMILAFLQYVFRPFRRPLPHGVIDLLLEKKRPGVLGLFDSLKMFFFKRSVDLSLIWGKADVRAYAAEYGIPTARLRFCPHHITLEKYQFEIEDRGFIFSGGNGQRDYKTLIAALDRIETKTIIATNLPGIKEMAAANSSIEVRSVGPQEFRRIMACSRLVVLCADPRYLRTMGHQTFLNAMWMGKPVILADEKSAEGYIVDGMNGFVVPAANPGPLRRKILQVLEDEDLRHRIGENAKNYARQPMFTTLNCMQTVYNEVLKIAAQRYGIPFGDVEIRLY